MTAISRRRNRRLRAWLIALGVLAFMSGVWVILYHAVVAMIEMWVGK